MSLETEKADSTRLVGHDWAVGLLQSSIDNHKVSHAYVFSGPAGIGKSYLAHQFVMALCCLQPPPGEGTGFRYCGHCRPCRMIGEDKHPDVTVVGLDWQARQLELAGTAVNANLKIDTVRTIQHEISRAPTEAPWRIFIVEDAATMQPAAANAFLKTLEEPPARALLILISDSDKALLPTIISRCQVFELRSVPSENIRQALLAEGAKPEKAHLLAALAVGRPGYALRTLHDHSHRDLDDRDEALMFHDQLLLADRASRLAFAEEMNVRWQSQGERRASVVKLVNLWLGWWRDLALTLNGQTGYVTNQDRLEQLRNQSRHLNMLQVRKMLQGLTRVQAELDSNVSPRLAVGDLLLNQLPRLSTI